ncbi:MAG: Protein of unknown function (DUF1217) [Roseibaca calidilacus]|nr:MAG: Protein of unknown function (DUF1217) [Roseibaca calidilacus]
MTLRKTTSYTRVLAALHDESGAVSVDWVVLSAATLTLGMGAATLVQTGTVSLGEAINATLSSTQSNDSGFSFYRLTEQQQQEMLASYMDRTPEQLRENSSYMSAQFLSRLESGNLDEAARWIDRRQLNQTALDARGLDADEGAMTVAQMEQMFRDAGGT